MTQHNVHHAFVIEVAGETAGIIVREERGVRFHSSGPRFDRHDAHLFANVRAAERALREAALGLRTARAA